MTAAYQNQTSALPACRPWRAHAPAMRYALCSLIVLLSAMAMVRLSVRLMGQLRYHEAQNLLRQGYAGLALAQLEKAVQTDASNPDVHKALGRVYFEIGALQQHGEKATDFARQSRIAFETAATLNPLDAEAVYGLARAEKRLSELHAWRHPDADHIPYEPGRYFEQAMSLRPNGVLYRYAYVRYLHDQNRTPELMAAVRDLARIYPSSCRHIAKEPFYTPAVQAACVEGLTAAINDKISPRAAHTGLSAIHARDCDWPGAIQHYKTALTYQSFDNRAGHYVHLGGLYLRNHQPDDARSCFLKALNMSASRDQTLKRIYHLYRVQKDPEGFERFYRDMDRRLILPTGSELLLARSLVALKQYSQAERILTQQVQERPDADAFYWLARIHEIEKDWDRMELAIQKATVLEPDNSDYHLLFSRSFKQQKKLERAEKEATLAIAHRKRPSPWLYNHRAWVRWQKKDYAGALQDWIRAVGLKPESASLHACAGMAHARLGHFSAARKQYERAMQLEPGNARYAEKYRDIRDHMKANISH